MRRRPKHGDRCSRGSLRRPTSTPTSSTFRRRSRSRTCGHGPISAAHSCADIRSPVRRRARPFATPVPAPHPTAGAVYWTISCRRRFGVHRAPPHVRRAHGVDDGGFAIRLAGTATAAPHAAPAPGSSQTIGPQISRRAAVAPKDADLTA
jgi:hypothetical protein